MYHSMVYDVCGFLKDLENIHPIGAHPKCFQQWRQMALDHLQQDLGITAVNDKHTWDVCMGVLEYREHMHAHAWERCMRGDAGQTDAAPPSQTAANSWHHLLEHTQVQQRTPEWFEEGRRILTASEFWKALDTPRAWSNLIVSKLPPSPDTPPPLPQRLACMRADMNAMDWGTCLEPVVKYVLQEKKGWVIRDLGRIRHPNGLAVAASPDGIIEKVLPSSAGGVMNAVEGHLVEIKCPKTRVLNTSVVPFEYWCQMQIQMECTNRPACEYVEMKFTLESLPHNTPFTPSPNQIAVVQNQDTRQLNYIYGFSQEAKESLKENTILLEVLEWKLLEERLVQIPRDTFWFESVKPIIAKFAAELEAALRGEWKPLPPLERKKRAAPPVQCAIQDTPPASPQLTGAGETTADSAAELATLPTLSTDEGNAQTPLTNLSSGV